ncbi:Pyruvate kinase [Zostera marina]|uniref:Pyruvate kinase n=1 Tax=Zostera marina TaxID=29655 RepID=A0A0K9Q3Y1_ZOSMR|nr:Pyruvate kinase [Zostera marina]
MENTGIQCAVMLDTKGPEIRTGSLKDGKPIHLEKGKEITISTDYDIEGDENTISMSYKKLAENLKEGDTILCSDGTITLKVLDCNKELGQVQCRCENSAMLEERKNVTLPKVTVDLPTLTENDKKDIMEWGVPNKIDIIAISFVRKGSDVVQVRNLLGEHAAKIMLMSKVENWEGLVNSDDIITKSDAFMVARGDLGMDILIEQIFCAQKQMISKCNIKGKPVVTATQMLDFMIKFPRPTRAEATDVANAVLDGTDCVMLSGETANGGYPEEVVLTMAKICVEAENFLDDKSVFKRMMASSPTPMTTLESLASSVIQTGNAVSAAFILVFTRGGTTARLVAKYRPTMPILPVVVPKMNTDGALMARRGLISRGILPVFYADSPSASYEGALEI